MATAAEHKIIIEKGADYKLEVQISNSGVATDHVDVADYSIYLTIQYADENGDIQYLVGGNATTMNRFEGTKVPDVAGADPLTYDNGNMEITVDKAITAGFPTRTEPFKTAYEYFYHVDIESTTGTETRILRGKCAIRD